jgi:RNA-directed DNA polymerase
MRTSKDFFDNVSHDKLMGLLERRIVDKKFLRYVKRILKSGCMEDGRIHVTDQGTPQGGNISPMLANIFLHYVLDEWFEKEIKPGLRGQSHIVRYCDDFVILVRYKDEAKIIMEKVKERFKEFGLELNETKTQIMSFGFFEKSNAKKQGRKANTFDFLGLTHYCSETRRGKFKVSRKTSSKRLNSSLNAIGTWIKFNRMLKIRSIWDKLSLKIRGHYQYYGVSDNSRSLEKYNLEVKRIIYKWMNRRSQRQSFNWEQFDKYLKRYPLPKPKIVYSFYTT